MALFGAPLGAVAVEPSESANRLDHPFLDVVLLEPAGPDDAPRLLVLDAIPPAAGSVHLSILERDRAWIEVRSLTVGFPPTPGVDQPWLVRLGPSEVALLAATPATGSTTVVLLRTDGGTGGDDLIEVERADLPADITFGGAIDVDADGREELVLGSPAPAGADGCRSSTVWVMRPGELARPIAYQLAGHAVSGGALGGWDAVPGGDLLAYASDGCAPVDDPTGATLQALRLADGAPILSLDMVGEVGPGQQFLPGAPLRLPLAAAASGRGADATAMDAAAILGPTGLTLLDPADGWRSTAVGEQGAIPIASTAGAAPGSARLLWMERGSVVTASLVARDADGLATIGSRIELPRDGQDRGRLATLLDQVLMGFLQQRPGVAWHGVIGQDDCPDLLVQGARFPCGSRSFEPGAAWIGTRPLTTLGEGTGRRLLVAAGMEPDRITGLPVVPTPAATGTPGWWRKGASRAFALAELRAGDAVYYNEFPRPRSSVERVSQPDSTTALPGFTGTRLLVQASASAMAEDGKPPGQVGIRTVFAGTAPTHDLRTVLRIPVPPGLDSGRDGAAIRVPLNLATLPDGEPAGQWGVRVVPLNDWGEVGPMAVGLVQRDGTGPTLVVGEPFTTPVWPLPARLTGSAEPGSTVVIDGVGEATLDRRGQFAFQTTLAPWPQTVRVTATDASGNRTVREVSIIGGVDYRRFPWAVIAAVGIVLGVAASGWRGASRRGASVGPAGGSATVIEEWPSSELEELEPGAGLPPGGGEARARR